MMIESTHCLDAVFTFPDETIPGRTGALGKPCLINVAVKPTALSSKFYNNNSQDVRPAECT